MPCQAGSNQVSLTLTGSGGPITVSTNQQGSAVSGTTVEISLDVVPNQAIVIYAAESCGVPGTTQYWVRRLPPEFSPPSRSTRPGRRLAGMDTRLLLHRQPHEFQRCVR